MTKKQKQKLTGAERTAKRERKKNTMIIFVNGRQKRIRRPQPELIDGIPIDEFIAHNADEIWLHQNELWHLMPSSDLDEPPCEEIVHQQRTIDVDQEVPF